jgi:serine/threonine protein kinase
MIMIDKTISHYKIVEKLGEGGMGEVYLAQDTKLKRQVAIKFLPEHLTKDKENVVRFEREAEAAAALNHPNIVTIHDVIEENGHLCIVMEYVEGKSLRDVINESSQSRRQADQPTGAFPIPNYIDIITQISEGLSKAHQAGIVHRDIKPENIIIDHDARVKILDFGLAKLKGVSKLTKDNSTVGTMHYMSPEQLRGEQVDQRSDIWSLGVVFYEMVSGNVPFKGDYDQAVAYSIQSEAFDPIEEIAPEYNEMLNKLLAKKPENRYQNLEELIDALGENKESKKTSKARKRHRYFVYLLSIFALIVAGYFLSKEVVINVSQDVSTEWENSIGVLPFDNISNDPEQDYFCKGMTEQIISNLSRLPQLKVISRQGMMKYKDTDKTISEIGKELDVAYVLESSIRKFGDRIRVTAQLINTKDDFHVWSEDYDREYKDLLDLQDDVSEAIARNLLKTISAGDAVARFKENRPKNLEAWEYYSGGKYNNDRFISNISNQEYFNKSEEMLKKAIERDPGYAPSYAVLADLYNTYFNYVAAGEEEKQKYSDLQEKYIEAGIKVDPQSADLYYVKGYYLESKGDWRGAYDCFIKSIKFEPHNDGANFALGQFYGLKGLHFNAIKYVNKAIETNPLNFSAYRARGAYYSALGNKKQAIADAEKSLEIAPDCISCLHRYSMYLLLSNRISEAEEIIKRIEKLDPNNEGININKSIFHAFKGEKEKAFEYCPDGNLTMFLLLKMADETIDFFNKKYKRDRKPDWSIYLELSNVHSYDFLRSDPRFQEILEKEKKIYDELLDKYPDIDI